jgi:hypothetical protein
MVEQGNWTNLKAPIEEMFIHAAFLILPHHLKAAASQHDRQHDARGSGNAGSNAGSHISGSGSVIGVVDARSAYNGDENGGGEEVEGGEDEGGGGWGGFRSEDMGHEAFKSHARDMLTAANEDERRQLVRDRFRAALVSTAPYCLRLKSDGVSTVRDLVKVNLTEYELPPILHAQIEALLNVAVALSAKSKLAPKQRDHLATNKELFTGKRYLVN